MSGHAPSQRTHCQNCGSPLSGPYCPTCGQHDVDYNQSFWHVLEDALEGFLHFEGKFFRSARYVFTRPGFLTLEFIAGRRARYMNPVRFYIFASFLFFAFSVLASHHARPAEKAAAKAHAAKDVREALAETREEERDSAVANQAPQPKGTPGLDADLTVQASWLDDPLRLKIDPKDKVRAKDFKDEFWHLLPAMLFFCLPFLALVQKVVYIRSGRLYVEHLIFALHVQTLAFLSFVVIKAGGMVGSLIGKRTESVVGYVLLLGMFCLIFRAFRVVYGQGRVKTAFKLALVLAAYGLILIFGVAGLGAVSIYLVSRSA